MKVMAPVGGAMRLAGHQNPVHSEADNRTSSTKSLVREPFGKAEASNGSKAVWTRLTGSEEGLVVTTVYQPTTPEVAACSVVN